MFHNYSDLFPRDNNHIFLKLKFFSNLLIGMKLKTEIFKIDHSPVTLKGGRLLISEPFLSQSCFQRAVVLLVEHSLTGSMGLVINKPCNLMLNSFVSGLDNTPEIPVFCGGPVATDRLFYIHTLGYLIPNSIEIADGLYIDGDFDAILSYINSGNKIEGNIKFFMGYSGWDKDQLEYETKENVWVVIRHPNVEKVMKGEGDLFWKETVQKLGNRYKPWLNYPKNPYLN